MFDKYIKYQALLLTTVIFASVAPPVFAGQTSNRCPVASDLPVFAPHTIPAGAPGALELSGDSAEIDREGISTLTGNVIMTRDQQQLQSDTAVYNNATGIVETRGNVRYRDHGLTASSSQATFDTETGRGIFEDAKYWLTTGTAHGKALRVTTGGDLPTELAQPDYTTCIGDNPVWQLSADTVVLDHAADVGTARNTIVRIHGIPVLYSPWLSFPLSDKRKSGFLFPSFGQTSESGFELATPWYWNIAPDRDATLTPRYLDKRGAMLGAEYRYLHKHGKGTLQFEYLPHDETFGDDRGAINIDIRERFNSHWSVVLDINYVSDKEYLEELNNGLSINSTTHLNNRLDLTYRNAWLWSRARVQAYQTVTANIDPLSRPYARLPQVLFRAAGSERNRQVNFRLDGEVVSFDRDDGVTGIRTDLRPSVSLPMRSVAGFVVPKFSVWNTWYNLDNTAVGTDDSPSRTVPVFSLDAGLFFERDAGSAKQPFLHTFEPRVFFLYKPRTGQDDIPDFDTSQFTFSYNQLFRENRFSGRDRVGDASQVSVSLTSRLFQRSDGREILRGSVGQIFYFRDRDVTLPGGLTETDSSSDIIGEIIAHLAREWRLRGDVQWNPHTSRTQKSAIHLRYKPDNRRILNLGYRQRSGTTDVDQTDVSLRWPLSNNWSVLGRWNWSLQESRSLETFAGVEYNSCCWAFRAVARRNLNTYAGDYNTGIFLQVELKGLGGLGSKTVSFLKQSIPGYQNEF